MRRCLPFAFLLGGAVLLNTHLNAQQSDRFAYAVTDVQNEGSNWSYLRKLNLQTGEYSSILLSGNDASLLAYDANTKKQFTAPLTDARYGNTVNAAFATGVAAMAYDKKSNRLYYTPMFIDQLRYIDLKSMKVYYVTDKGFTGMSEKSSDQGNIVTRMVIASDGNGYAMTNDAMHLIRFTTGKKSTITDLGMITDATSNKGVSVHNSCSSFGGDMIADDDGNIFIFSARNHIFKVDIETKVATHVGAITGLPNNFTVNGAAVDENNKILVSSAMESLSYFTLDTKTWAATPYAVVGTVWHSSDLANSNLLVSGNRGGSPIPDAPRTLTPASTDNSIQIFPNPITNNQFAVQFNQLEPGNYTIQITDVMGRQIQQQVVNVSGDNQTQNIKLNPSATKGIYMVKVTSQSSKAIFSTKLIVQ